LERLMPTLDDYFPVTFIGRCRSCGRLGYIDINNPTRQCGPDFATGRMCYGAYQGVDGIEQEVLLAAYKLGGEEAVEKVLEDAGLFSRRAHSTTLRPRRPR
jgi:hypothetical protein